MPCLPAAEMSKAGVIDEMMSDAMDSALGDDDLEEETEEQVCAAAWGVCIVCMCMRCLLDAHACWLICLSLLCGPTTPGRWTRCCWRWRGGRWPRWRRHPSSRSRWDVAVGVR